MKFLGLVLLVGCGFQSSASMQAMPVDGSDVDASVPGPMRPADASPPPIDARPPPIDAPDVDAPPAVDASLCFGTGLLRLCLPVLPTSPAPPLGDRTLDTGNSSSCTHVFAQMNGPGLCVITGTTVTVNGLVSTVGSRALVLVATDAVIVSAQGTIDASSRFAPRRTGAAANTGACSPAGSGENDGDGAGGGAGGSFGSQGGNGGTGTKGSDAAGGTAGGTQTTLSVVRGGCPGGSGGARTALGSGDGPAGGDGGGAVYLIAGNRITIDGDVFASGSGGGTNAAAAGRDQGGGGGGTGGLIGLDAPEIRLGPDAHVVANGGAGGGGGGSSGSNGEGGAPGNDGTTSDFNARAAGGIGHLGGGNGGPGTALGATNNLNGASTDAGGGGGGGGIGIVLRFGALNDASKISPPPLP